MMAARVVVSLALLCAAFLTWRSDHEVRDIESWTASTEVMLAPRADPAQPWTQVNAMWELAESKRNAVEDLREFLEDSAIGVAAYGGRRLRAKS